MENKITHLETEEKILCEDPKVCISFTKIKKNNEISYVCGKFDSKNNFIYRSQEHHSKDRLYLSISQKQNCQFCDNFNAGIGGYRATCRLYNQKIEKAANIWSNKDHALCCEECINKNIKNKEINENSSIFPIYVQNYKNSDFYKKDIDVYDKNFSLSITIKNNSNLLEEEYEKIMKKIFESQTSEKIKEYENKNIRCISQYIDMIKLYNGDFLVFRFYQEYPKISPEAIVLTNEDIDKFVETYLN